MLEREFLIRLILAAFMGGIIGFERETHGRAAGLRTHILVCMGSCLLMVVSIYSAQATRGVGVCDPSRIAAGVVTGLGFLGAGTIMRFKATVKGLTTAASLWTAGGIGLTVGIGFYSAAFSATLLVVITLIFVGKLEKALHTKGLFRKVAAEDDELL